MLVNPFITFIMGLAAVLSSYFTLAKTFKSIGKYLREAKPGKHLSILSINGCTLRDVSLLLKRSGLVNNDGRQLLFLDLCLTNYGTKDIKLQDAKESIFLSCGEKFKWLAHDEYLQCPKTDFAAEIVNGRELKMTWHLLKKKEKINLKLLAECPDSGDNFDISEFTESLKVDERTENLKTEVNFDLSPEKKQARTRYFWYGSLGLICVVVGAFLLIGDVHLSTQNSLSGRQGVVYRLADLNHGGETTAIVRYDDNKRLNVLFDPHSEDSFVKRFSIAEFNRKYALVGVENLLIPKNITFVIIGWVLFFSGLILIGVNAIRLWALGNKSREYWFRYIF